MFVLKPGSWPKPLALTDKKRAMTVCVPETGQGQNSRPEVVCVRVSYRVIAAGAKRHHVVMTTRTE